MLRRNLDVANGLANGKLGTCEGFKTNDEGDVTDVLVKIDGEDGNREIQRCTADFEVGANIFFTRSQFPLTLG